jgi:AcrR family transcriptional regulator
MFMFYCLFFMTVSKPKQKRSQETLDKITASCDALLAKATFEEISMQAIANHAGISVGNLYNRFSNKEALIGHLIERTQSRYFESVLTNLKSIPSDLNLADRLVHLVSVLEITINDNAALLKAVASRNLARRSSRTETTDQQARQVIESLANWLFQSGDEIKHPNAKEACRFAITSIIFGLQYRLIFDTPDRLFGLEKYKSRLAEMALAFLTQPTA